ncbi:GNAT family N-acetyltransferase [Rhodococcus sp. ACT016]|uniref:GNAT family N-acetyltransferase n=1 Tax=Rhodococcus sp. ACT016 TaxID=3134808 RepID=UPI003D28E997
MKIREFGSADRNACLDIVHGNTPDFFAPSEVGEFAAFLDDPGCPYYVLEDAGEVVACGGWSIRADGAASLCWGMVKRTQHRKGIGSFLFRERLRLIRGEGSASRVALVTSQHSKPFFERHGFTVTGIEVDGFAPGLDAVTMRLEI